MARLRNLLACLALFTAYADAGGQDFQSLQSIRAAALSTLQVDASSQALLSPGLRLPACQQPLEASANSPTVADVRCPDNPGWRLFVPVRLAAGSQARRAVAPEAEPESAVIVKRGDPVMLRASLGGTEVTMRGRALGQARSGGIVNVENLSSHRIIRGRLAEDGAVEVLN